jgi:tetrahydromethanopterin S-methyltransferase subunit E
MAVGLIIFGLIIFLFGFVTPVSDLYTLPISIIVIVIGIIRLIKNRNNSTIE